jgi:hypothetical protein
VEVDERQRRSAACRRLPIEIDFKPELDSYLGVRNPKRAHSTHRDDVDRGIVMVFAQAASSRSGRVASLPGGPRQER